MPKFAIVFAGLLGLAACQSTNTASSFDNATPVQQIAEPTDGIATE